MSSSHDITLTPQEQALIMRLKSFRVPEMAHILEEQLKDPNADLNTFMERMTAMVDAEWQARADKRFNRLMKEAHLRYPAADLDETIYRPERQLDTQTIERLSTCHWIEEGKNLIVTGSSASGKTYLINAFCVTAMKQSKENIETLKKCVDYFEISLDGVDESSCSKIRGEGVFEKVVETVHFLKENGCGEISLSMVICDKNQDLEEEFKKLNIKLGTHPIVRVLSFVGRGKEKRDELSLMSQGEVYIPDKFFDTERPYVFWGNCLEKNRKRMIRANGDIYTCPLIIDEELKENNILRVSDLSEVENGKLYNLKEKLLSQNPKCRTCKVNPFCWNCIATIKENTENGAMDDYCSKVKAFYFNTVWGE